MTEIIADQYQVIKDFVAGKEIELEKILISPNLFKVSLYYKKYDSAVTMPVARFITEHQILVYKIAALLVHKKADIRKLTNEQKRRLEVPFKIMSGSTDSSADLLEQARGILAMIPDEYKAIVVICLIVAITGYKFYGKYIDHKDKLIEAKTILEKEKIHAETINKAIDAIADDNKNLSEIVREHRKGTLNALIDMDGELTYQGEAYTPENIKEIKKMEFPRKPSAAPEAKQLKGKFRVVAINLERKYINIKRGDDVEKVYYADDLIAKINDFKTQFKNAIDNEGKFFYIEAGYTVKNGKTSPLVLHIIQSE